MEHGSNTDETWPSTAAFTDMDSSGDFSQINLLCLLDMMQIMERLILFRI